VTTRGGRLNVMLAAFYIAWMCQSFFLQHLFDYVYAPGIILAIAVLATLPLSAPARLYWRSAVAAFLVLATCTSPVVRADRLEMWSTCLTQGSTPQVRNRLALLDWPDWEAMSEVEKFLRDQQVRHGEVTCYNNDLIYIYWNLNLKPSTRFVYAEALMMFFPDERERILNAIQKSPQRFIISDLHSVDGLSEEDIAAISPGQPDLPPAFPVRVRKIFPFNHPVVFRSGSIVVHDARPIPTMPAPQSTAESADLRNPSL